MRSFSRTILINQHMQNCCIEHLVAGCMENRLDFHGVLTVLVLLILEL